MKKIISKFKSKAIQKINSDGSYDCRLNPWANKFRHSLFAGKCTRSWLKLSTWRQFREHVSAPARINEKFKVSIFFMFSRLKYT